ncbi:enoyl-CoA hydratase/isomerase family protein [Nocardia cyriacigeorgica]|uniref:Enoyl-CoA hydratase/isomerase family protein n=1 Tax=Nocardia cyriacigeorgica TaxID=135487 RepID=A0A6P1D4R4_9NOCA|nr:enoyl-CoA hydratase-related protein [Nocardia cyriacigeorgica]NEW37803.1 enoyl-CoA hydratase/isomerase family protein [Nocardia cyriacigeorgica]NEW45596.1 enoyl-CoA hydratase/isomerase family protein [Nocardia cyriacigeorgica]NEW48812.1 enoyl-CoA hydratase/isomerase family protein [Nocardia cyriacigeorgica]NEW56184.1 enoyl-CoA hydratase/isomerase family protein [Nocardia cyriacigeorgica]
MPTLDYHDKIAVLDLGDGENRFSPTFLDEMNTHLDAVLADGAHALITTASAKFYSNGLDLDWLSANGERADWYVDQVHGLFARVLTLGVPTVAAMPGHAFGAGAMLAIAHDYRIMRADRGYFCFPEVDIHIPFTPGMAALIQAKLTPQAAVASMTTGRRWGGVDAAAAGIVDATAAEGELVRAATQLLAPLGAKDQGTLAAIKQTMFTEAITALTGHR